MKSRKMLRLILLAALSCGALGQAGAQQFPAKPIRVINPASPGGNSLDEHDAFIKSEIAQWKKVAQDAKIDPQ